MGRERAAGLRGILDRVKTIDIVKWNGLGFMRTCDLFTCLLVLLVLMFYRYAAKDWNLMDSCPR